jgi:hypothetical protein
MMLFIVATLKVQLEDTRKTAFDSRRSDMKQQLLAVVATMIVAAPAAAQSPRWSVAFNAGGDVSLSGMVHDGGTGRVLNLPTTVQARDYGDIYGTPFTWSADVGFLAVPKGEVRARVFQTRADATRVQVGDVATLPLFALFDPYEGFGMDAGYRQYMTGADSMVRPYAGAALGFLRTETINGTFSVPAANVVLTDVPMYASSTVLTFAFSAGALVPIGRNFGIQAGVDFRWHGDLTPVDGLAGTGLESINDESSRWSMPLTVGAVFRF